MKTAVASATVLVAVLASSVVFAEIHTFTKDVAPILQENCQDCHRPGQMAPMSLMTFEESRPWAKAIARMVEDRKMPPWYAHPDYGKFTNDVSMSDDERAIIVNWVNQGAKRGNPKDMPDPVEFAHEANEGGWRLGEPDIVLDYGEPYVMPADLENTYICFPMDLGFEHDIWIKGVEYRPGNPKIAHHYILFVDPLGVGRERDAANDEAGCECEDTTNGRFTHAWGPGNVQPLSPEGTAKRVKAGEQIVLQIHYTNTTGEAQSDQSRMALFLADSEEVIRSEYRLGLGLSNFKLNIPAGEANAINETATTVMQDTIIYAFNPHMHYRGKSMRIFGQLPGEEEQTLIWLPTYDFAWQVNYTLEEPIVAPKGTKLRLVSVHDNSTQNPWNPNPNADVTFGPKSSDEMAIGFLEWGALEKKLNERQEMPLRSYKFSDRESAAKKTD